MASTSSTTTTTTSPSSSSSSPDNNANLPPLQFTYLSDKEGVVTTWATGDFSEKIITEQKGNGFEYSADGSLLAIVTPIDVAIYETDTGKLLRRLEQQNIVAVAFSPKKTYLLSWHRTQKPEPNLFVWSIATGEAVVKLIQKGFSKDNWPSLLWSDDEKFCSRLASNEIQFYETKVGNTTRSFKLEGVAKFSVSPGPQPKIAAFVPEKKGHPAFIRVVKYPNFEVIGNKSFFKAQHVDIKWNSSGTALIVQTSTDVDQSGKSYYGENDLYFMSPSGEFTSINREKEGPIHESAWSNDGKEFIVIYGYMPAKITLYSIDGKPKSDFGSAPRNTVRWSPVGRMVSISGHGNLSGDMDIWDPKKLKKLGSIIRNTATHCFWSPNGHYLMTCILSPRLRVDNGLKLFSPDGTLVYHKLIPELYKILWRPAAPGVYPDKRPLLTKKTTEGATTDSSPTPATPTPAPVVTPTAAAPAPAKYRHPNFSANRTVPSLRSDDGPQKYVAKKSEQKNLPPGYSEDKPKRRRNRKKASNNNNDSNNNNNEESEDQAEAETEVQETTSQTNTGESSNDAQEKEKKIKALNKKIRQITQLKEQQAAGKKLDQAQLNKLNTEKSLKDELKKLQLS